MTQPQDSTHDLVADAFHFERMGGTNELPWRWFRPTGI